MSLADGSVAGVVLVETTLPFESVTVVVTEPFALVVTLVVSEDEPLPELDWAPLEPALEDAPLLGVMADEAAVLVELMDRLMGSGSGLCLKPATSIAQRC